MIIFPKGEKFVKVCLHSSKVVQISLYFDKFFLQKIQNSFFAQAFVTNQSINVFPTTITVVKVAICIITIIIAVSVTPCR